MVYSFEYHEPFVELLVDGEQFTRTASRMNGNRSKFVSPHIAVEGGTLCYKGHEISLPSFTHNVNLAASNVAFYQHLDQSGVTSYAIVPIYRLGEIAGAVSVGFLHSYFRWRAEDI